MKRMMCILAVLVSGALLLSGCESTTAGGATGATRSQLLLVSSKDVNDGSAKAYRQQMDKARSANALNANQADVKRVNAIAKRLIAQVGVFRTDALKWKWEVNVINSDTINAYCMPGGKIAVYTGIISKLNLTDDELAAVIGHEMSHALREHSREQISQQIAQEQAISLGGSLLGLGSISQSAASMIGQYALTLPFSRTMEAEADVMGMELMARAGYNPESAVNVWRKMSAAGGDAPPEILSTHPSDESRIANLERELPKVMPLYQRAIGKNVVASSQQQAPTDKKSLRAPKNSRKKHVR
ncbi:MAG: M48 family metallopeptidase [Burkholderiaceae bacterium]|jgi:predicted Zn-dependent protease|nr:M48 family metallopeptidase [Burkholderiaceae bacterium]